MGTGTRAEVGTGTEAEVGIGVGVGTGLGKAIGRVADWEDGVLFKKKFIQVKIV